MKKLAIVGTHTRTRDNAPFEDPEYEIWVFNESPQQSWCRRWDVCFQLHKREVYTSPNNFVRRDHWDWLKQEHPGNTIYMQDYDPEVPASVAYPLDKVIETIPAARTKWFKSSFSYAAALALYLGYTQVDFYGADMASSTEYSYQLPNFQYWIGVLLGAGVEIDILSNEQYFTAPLYGFEGEIQIPREHFSKRAETLKGELKSAEWQREKLKKKIADYIQAGRHQDFAKTMTDLQNICQTVGEIMGAMDVAEKYAMREDLIPRQEFERAAATAQHDGEKAREKLWMAAGEAGYVWNIWKQTKRYDAAQQLDRFMTVQLVQAQNLGAIIGVFKENYDYMTEYDKLLEAAGGQRTLAALGVTA